MPAIREESFGTGNQKWLGSMHGVYNAESGNIDISAFTSGTHYPTGYLKAGTPLGRLTSGKKYVPYNSGGSGGAEVLAGFLLTDQKVSGSGEDFNAPVLMHGIINVDYLPVSFTVPTNKGAFVYVGAGV